MKKRKLILYIAMSVDGYIARKNGDLDWLDTVAQEGEDYGYQDFINQIDTVVVGRKTYEKVISMVGIEGFPHKDKVCYVMTRQAHQTEGNVIFYHGDLAQLITELKAQQSEKHIFCDGGAEIVNELMKANLIDEYIISIIPNYLGSGILLFKEGRPETKLELIDCKKYPTGLVQLHYITTN
ncbi:MAG: dihydrofolate reductase family protein [Thermoflexibacter sp.]|jgi:dihydrofolate reductase|nr:dihydrofolate reductase family protein [Thermoflexibacter sp.]